MTAAGRPLLALHGVRLTLGRRQILQDVSFQVAEGETKVLLGGSGSGKTTVLKLMLGLTRPDRGSIDVGGRDIAALPERELATIRGQMAMVFQSAALFDSLSVRENVAYRLSEQRQLTTEAIEARVRESLRFVGLEDTLEKMPAELSGGMKKRVGIARGIASGARVLLYDEPTTGLDPVNTRLICRLILRLKRQGVTQAVVTHDLDTAYRVADGIVMLHHGRVIFDGPAHELARSPDPVIHAFVDPGTDAEDEGLLRPHRDGAETSSDEDQLEGEVWDSRD